MKHLSLHRGTLLASALVAVLLTTGCDGFLTETNKSSITQDNYYQTPAQAESAINGLYPTLRFFTSSAGYGESQWVSLDLLVGHAMTNGQSDRNRQFIAHSAGSEHPAFRDFWNNLYFGISNANVAIASIPKIDMDEAQKNRLLGQAHFMRAFYYYHLVRLYGDVPLLTEPVDATSPELYPDRDPAEAVYELIVSDLKTAEQSGLPNVDASGRVSLGAVKSLLSSVYLTMAGQPLNKTEYYQLAADKAEEVIDSGWYTLFTDYAYLHDRAHKNQGEFIFQVQYQAGIATHGITQLITPENEGISPFGDEFGSLRPINEFVASYETGDKRTEEQQFYFSKYTLEDGTVKEFGEWALYKYWLDEAAGLNGDMQDDQNWTLLRLPEVMLIYAEAINEATGGPTPKAYDQINAIRERADLDPLSGLSQEEFRQAVWRERYHELAYENKAYFDIQRTRKIYDLVNNRFVDAVGFTNEQGTTWSEKYLLWAIPDSELQTNPNLTQNDGWS